jgi:hypothetical protein
MHALSRDWSLRVGAELLESSLLWGRMHAISANTSMMLVVDSDGRRFFWADPASGDSYPGSVRAFPPGVRITASPRRPLRFYQHGNAAPAGTFVVAGERAEYRLVVSPGGRTRVQRS